MCYYLHMYVYVITCTFMLLLAQCVITCAGVSLSAQVCFYLYRCVVTCTHVLLPAQVCDVWIDADPGQWPDIMQLSLCLCQLSHEVWYSSRLPTERRLRLSRPGNAIFHRLRVCDCILPP